MCSGGTYVLNGGEMMDQAATMTEETAPAGAKIGGILIVDDHPIVRSGLAQLIRGEEDLHVCGQADDAEGALRAIASHPPEIVLVDISLQDSNGIELIRAIRGTQPDLPVLVLSMHDENLYAQRALKAGAQGYVMKQEEPTTVLRAIRRVLGGDVYVSERIASRMLQQFVGSDDVGLAKTGLSRLSDRELEVFELIGRGMSSREIADKLHRSVKTIETRRAHIKRKLELRNAAELMQHAVNWVGSAGVGRAGA